MDSVIWYLKSFFIDSELGKYILSFMLLYLLIYGLLETSGIFKFSNNERGKKIKAVLSMVISVIALYHPSTKSIIFSVISNVTLAVFLLFAFIVVVYMSSKILLHYSFKDDAHYKHLLFKIQKIFLFVFLAVGIGIGIYILYPYLPVDVYAYFTTFIPSLVGIGIAAVALYYVLIRPIIGEVEKMKEESRREKIKEINKSIEEGKLEGIIEVLKRQHPDLRDEEISALALELLKRKG